MGFIAGLLIGAMVCFFLMKNDQAFEKPNGRKDFGGASAEARYKIFILAQGKFRSSKYSQPLVASYAMFTENPISFTRVVRVAKNASGQTIVFDEESGSIEFQTFQTLLRNLSSFPGVWFQEAENKNNLLKVTYSFVLQEEHYSIEYYFMQ